MNDDIVLDAGLPVENMFISDFFWSFSPDVKSVKGPIND